MSKSTTMDNKKYGFVFTKGHIGAICHALDLLTDNLNEQIDDDGDEPIDEDVNEYNKETLKIAEPLCDYLQAIDGLTDRTPDIEPLVQCEFVYSKAMKEGSDEYFRNAQKLMRISQRHGIMDDGNSQFDK